MTFKLLTHSTVMLATTVAVGFAPLAALADSGTPATTTSPAATVPANPDLAVAFKKAAVSNGVLQYYNQQTNQIFTYVPLFDLLKSKEEIEQAFMQAQDAAKQMAVEWSAKAFMTADNQKGLNATELAKVKAWDARIRAGQVNENNVNGQPELKGAPIADRIALLTDFANTRLEIQNQMQAFTAVQVGYHKLTGKEMALDLALPTATLAFVSFKVPSVILNWLNEESAANPAVAGLVKLLDGTATHAWMCRPWRVSVINVDSRDSRKQVVASYHDDFTIDCHSQLWVNTNVAGADPTQSGNNVPVRFGVGAVWGKIADMDNLGGFFGGYSYSHTIVVKNLTKVGPAEIPVSLNARGGMLVGQNLNPYVMLSYQAGSTPPNDHKAFAGFVAPLSNLYNFISSIVTSNQPAMATQIMNAKTGPASN